MLRLTLRQSHPGYCSGKVAKRVFKILMVPSHLQSPRKLEPRPLMSQSTGTCPPFPSPVLPRPCFRSPLAPPDPFLLSA